MREEVFLLLGHLCVPNGWGTSLFTLNEDDGRKGTDVSPVPSGSNTASQPKTLGPLAGTIDPSVRPSKIIGSEPVRDDPGSAIPG
jgi:hypothetical protein